MHTGVRIFGWDSCRIARMTVSRSCTEVRDQLRALGAVPLTAEEAAAATELLRKAEAERKKGTAPDKRKNSSWVRVLRVQGLTAQVLRV